MPSGCSGPATILGSIVRLRAGQVNYSQDEYRYDFNIFDHFRQLKKFLQTRNHSGACRVAVPDRQQYWGKYSIPGDKTEMCISTDIPNFSRKSHLKPQNHKCKLV